MSALNKMSAPHIFRYDFSPSFVIELSSFAEIHMNDDRKEYNTAWSEWCEQHDSLVTDEKQRLKQSGYDGDIDDKMYKAGRYYFRKKSKARTAPETEMEILPPKKKTKMYVTVQQETLSHMDAHINIYILGHGFSPKVGYENFATEHQNIIASESDNLERKYEMSSNDIKNKLKKTYKNRYYIITRSKNG